MFLNLIIIASVLVVLFTLVMGLIQLASNSEEARIKSNQWMWRRIYAQGGAVVIMLIAVWLKTQSG
ncbi:HIG1 domain-containing protein [Robiginitomaculum antarcticum]|uniref:HIG1 domain-containing protein n=1 Tax=Robiginitomaculum antarcticum TaxID=437507 RepID=UPI000370D7C2|nr:HIG1 domain-containing protein [Robiginitomaculum antarcticum]